MKMIRLTMTAALVLATACSPNANEPPESASAPSLTDVEYAAPQPVVLRLTQEQYRTVVHDVLGDEIAIPARLEPDIRTNGSLVLGSAKTTISPRGVELYEEAAISIAGQALDDERRAELLPCAPEGAADAACAEQFVRQVGRRLWRRPLDADEVARLVTVATTAAETVGDFHEGLEYSLSALLQSPNFLFRRELGTLSGDARVLDAWELASRLSFFIWNTVPDDELLAAAEDGSLLSDEVLEQQLDRLLEDPRSRRGVRRFFSDVYELERLDDLVKAPEIFEHASESVAPSAREETLRTIEWLVFDERADFRRFLTTRTTFLNRKLASMYEVRAPAREGFAMHEYEADSPRVGFLGQVSFLAMAAHPTSTSPTLRGKFIRQKLLCHSIPPPPAGVDTSIPEPSGDAPTLRARVQRHLSDPACAGCHQITDPIGLGLENFDGIGRYRDRDNGVVIDPSGDLDGTEFDNARDLGRVLSEHPDFTRCLTRKLYAYGTGQEVDFRARPMVEALDQRWQAMDYDFLSLMREIALSPGFREVRLEDSP